MKTPEEKAIELGEKFFNQQPFYSSAMDTKEDCERKTKINFNNAIESALICVDEIIKGCENFGETIGIAFELCKQAQYWQQVKTHLEQMK